MTVPPDLPLTPADVEQIVKALNGSAFETLALETPRFTLRLTRSGAVGWSQEWTHRQSAEAPAALATAQAEAEAISAIGEGLVAIHAPLPGSFYHSPQPGAPPFVTRGDTIGADTVIGIIETMKVMNSVPAGVAGEVVAIVAADGTMVDQRTALIHVRPGSS